MSHQEESTKKPKPETSLISLKVATVAGIPIRIHFTFWLFLTWVALEGSSMGSLAWPILVVAVFACVVLHELGHALVAKKFGIQTRDITLYPIGGLAVLQTRPVAKQELWIAIAGPAVNAIIAAILVPFVFFGPINHQVTSLLGTGKPFVENLLIANVTLCVFNLIPAFPMDGGRILRSLLAMATDDAKATKIAVSVGQILAICLLVWGLVTSQVVLMLMAFFVFVVASQELTMSVTHTLLEGHTVRDAMMTSFQTLTSGLSMEEAGQILLQGSQHNFPVANGDDILGILTRNDISTGLTLGGPSAYVAGYMQRNFSSVPPTLPLEEAIELMKESGNLPLLVFEDDQLLGMVTTDNIGEFIMLKHARSKSKAYSSRW